MPLSFTMSFLLNAVLNCNKSRRKLELLGEKEVARNRKVHRKSISISVCFDSFFKILGQRQGADPPES